MEAIGRRSQCAACGWSSWSTLSEAVERPYKCPNRSQLRMHWTVSEESDLSDTMPNSDDGLIGRKSQGTVTV